MGVGVGERGRGRGRGGSFENLNERLWQGSQFSEKAEEEKEVLRKKFLSQGFRLLSFWLYIYFLISDFRCLRRLLFRLGWENRDRVGTGYEVL